jgi:hypothetical protein
LADNFDGMIFKAEHITQVDDHTQTPDPGKDTWWSVDLGRRRPGWLHVAGSVPPPSEQWIAEELNRLQPRLGSALAGRMLGPKGMQLENAPRRE